MTKFELARTAGRWGPRSRTYVGLAILFVTACSTNAKDSRCPTPSPSEGTGGKFQRLRANSGREPREKGTIVRKKFSAAVARGQLSVLQMRVPNFDRDAEQNHQVRCAERRLRFFHRLLLSPSLGELAASGYLLFAIGRG